LLTFIPYVDQPRCSLGPRSILCVCQNCGQTSPLYRFYRDVTVAHWGNKEIVVDDEYSGSWVPCCWNDVFEKYPYFRDDLLMATREGDGHLKPLITYQVVEQAEETKMDASEDKAEEGFVESGVSGNTTVTYEGCDTPAATDVEWNTPVPGNFDKPMPFRERRNKPRSAGGIECWNCNAIDHFCRDVIKVHAGVLADTHSRVVPERSYLPQL
jgi:hypothetical protein